jgi:PelA/Pel-15E family pectate lyase
LQRPASWYGTPEALTIATNVMGYQSPEGGWPKNLNLALPPAGSALLSAAGGNANTIDNGATTTPLRFLARVVHATGNDAARSAFNRGLDYLLAAQYPNGGWPQYYPLRSGYYSHITYNDGAMVNVLNLLRDAANGGPPFVFVDAERRARAAAAVARGVECILRTQVRQHDRLTVWCAQHDARTLAPAPARNFEPASLSGAESVGIVRFLMSLEPTTPAVSNAIESAVAWFRESALHGIRIDTFTNAAGQRDRRVVEDAGAGPLWARFYELDTNRPLFVGRDRVPHYRYDEIEIERRVGYAYYTDAPADLLEKDYPRWRRKFAPARDSQEEMPRS